MSRFLLRYGVFTSIPLLALVLGVAGCGTSVPQGSKKATPAPASSKTEAGSDASRAQTGSEIEPSTSENLAKLPPQDRALAERQKTCPVTDALLGSMGVPCKVTLKGQTVFLCCAGCEEELNEHPDKYLAKLKGAESK